MSRLGRSVDKSSYIMPSARGVITRNVDCYDICVLSIVFASNGAPVDNSTSTSYATPPKRPSLTLIGQESVLVVATPRCKAITHEVSSMLGMDQCHCRGATHARFAVPYPGKC